jgi:hypothetical protein
MRLSWSKYSFVAVLLVLVVAPAAWAADPAAGTVSKRQDAGWTGGPFVVSNPAACLTGIDPVCDHFLLTVDARAGTHVAVAITNAAPETNDFDLFVYAPDGTLLASSATASGTEKAVFEHKSQYAGQAYEVRVQPWLVDAGMTYQGVAAVTREPVDVVKECLQPVPAAISLDFTEPVQLSTMVLLDGVTAERAQYVMGQAASSYASLNINLTWKLREVPFATNNADAMIQGAKDYFGGARPKGYDLVYVMTTKDIESGGNTAVAGLADCIGGVAFDDRAFGVGENFNQDESLAIGPTALARNLTAKVSAHEIGHLMGGHHHYANCAEGLAADPPPGELSPCTLMINAVDLSSLNFGTANGLVVRGHMEAYAP